MVGARVGTMTMLHDETARRSMARLRDVRLWRGVQRQMGLSNREIQVAILLVLGRSYREIGAELKIRPRTVATYVRRIKGKCHEQQRARLVTELLLASGLMLA